MATQKKISMARKKVKLEWIAKDAARRATFKKRRIGLIKKVSELSTLCGIDACLIVYGHNEPAPEVWPSVPEVAHVVARLKRMPEMEQIKKMMDQEGFMRQQIAKLQEKLRKQDRENRELETTLMMYQSMMGEGLEGAGIKEVTSLARMIEMKVSEVKKRIDGYKGNPMRKAGREAENAEEGPVGHATAEEKSPVDVAIEELQSQEYWFTDIMNTPPGNTYTRSMAAAWGGDVGFAAYAHTNPWKDAYFHLN